jgi:hypothetical protein
MKVKFSQQIFEKYSNVKFLENCPVEAKLFHVDGQRERHEANICF